MSQISDAVSKQNAYYDRVDNALSGIKADVQVLNDLIQQLQNSQGQVTPEDQALLDQLQQRGDAVATKVEAFDNERPPAAPPVDPNAPPTPAEPIPEEQQRRR